MKNMFSNVITICDSFVSYGIAMDEDDNIFVSDCNDHTIKPITQTNNLHIRTLAGVSSSPGSLDAHPLAATFTFPMGLSPSRGALFVADSHRIRKLTPDRSVATFAGTTLGDQDGKPTKAQFNRPFGVCVNDEGDVLVSDDHNHKIKKIAPNGVVSTFAGSVRGYSDGAGETAKFSSPRGLALDLQGNLIVADHGNCKIRKVTPDGDVERIAGTSCGYEDGDVQRAKFSYPFGVCVDDEENIFVADTYNHCIRMIANGVVTTVAGGPLRRGYRDGELHLAEFHGPSALCLDKVGNLYVCDEGNKKIRKIERIL